MELRISAIYGDEEIKIPDSIVDGVKIIEDVTKICDYAFLVIKDPNFFFSELLPFSMSTIIKIQITDKLISDSVEKTVNFLKDDKFELIGDYKIFQISHKVRTQMTDQGGPLVLKLINKHFYNLQKNRVNKVFKNKKISDMVKEIANNEDFKESEIEETLDIFTLYQPYWTDLQMLMYLNKFTYNKINSPYMYFINKNTIKYNSIYKEYTQESSEELTAWSKEPKKALDYADPSVFFDANVDIKPMLYGNFGGYGVKTTGYSFEDGYLTSTSKLSDHMNDENFLGRTLLFTEKDIDSNYIIENTGFNNQKILSTIAKKMNLMPIQNSIKCKLLTPGKAKRRAGQIIDLQVISGADTKKHNEILSGKWYINKLQHTYSNNNKQYFNHFVLSRNATNYSQIQSDGIATKLKVT